MKLLKADKVKDGYIVKVIEWHHLDSLDDVNKMARYLGLKKREIIINNGGIK